MPLFVFYASLCRVLRLYQNPYKCVVQSYISGIASPYFTLSHAQTKINLRDHVRGVMVKRRSNIWRNVISLSDM